MKYLCWKQNICSWKNYALVPLREQDIFLIKQWRNDQRNILRQNNILSNEEQLQYFNTVVVPSMQEKQPSLILLSFLLDNTCIGYGGLTYINWTSGRAELSFLLNTEYTKEDLLYKTHFSAYLKLIKNITFKDLSLNRIFTETFDCRLLHTKTLEKNGFMLEGRLRSHVTKNDCFFDSLIHGIIKDDYARTCQK
ncbi:MAG: GNAT family N-acetyltransferase [bacterium]